MKASENRRFQAILGLSALLHATLFATISLQRKPDALPRLIASIRLVEANPPGSVAAPAQAPAAIPPKARQEVQRAESRPAPHVTRTAGPANVPAPVVPAPGEAEVNPAPVASPAAASPVADTPRPAAPAQSDMLAAYRQRLTDLFARTHEYPRVAAMRGWEGEVRLRLKVARKGNLLGVQVDRSSGFDVLDRDALALLESHGSLPPLPEALEGNEIQVIVPINYKLRKTT